MKTYYPVYAPDFHEEHVGFVEVIEGKSVRRLPRLDAPGTDSAGDDLFGWGYGGEGPYDLAWALLRDVGGYDQNQIESRYHALLSFIARLPQNHDWRLTDADVRRIAVPRNID
jgi:hypothetical protein